MDDLQEQDDALKTRIVDFLPSPSNSRFTSQTLTDANTITAR